MAATDQLLERSPTVGGDHDCERLTGLSQRCWTRFTELVAEG